MTTVPRSSLEEHEHAAHEERAWVRLTYDCNNRCIFCLDSDTHDGEMRTREAVLRDILAGRRRGATRLILSGGEPTIHPDFIEFIRVGHRSGYRRVQTVTNGRLFAYPQILRRCVDEGLGEITFSIHGPNARIHDALVGVQGAYEQEITGLKWAIADGRPIVNVDVCVNRANVKHLRAMLDQLMGLGVREFDLLQVIPFGRAFKDGKETLFYDLASESDALRAAFEVSRLPGVHLWLNRFPIKHLEGFEELAQDPHKFLDEVRGRQEEFARLFETGEPLDCRQPDRCRHCYLEDLCDRVDGLRSELRDAAYDVVRLDTTWEQQRHQVAGVSDPASVKWLEMQRAAGNVIPALSVEPLSAVIERSGARRLWLVAPDVPSAVAALRSNDWGLVELELELGDLASLDDAIDGQGRLEGLPLARVMASSPAQLETLSQMSSVGFEVLAALTKANIEWLEARWESEGLRGRVALRQPNWDTLSQAAAQAVELAELADTIPDGVPVEGVPECLLKARPRTTDRVLDTSRHGPDDRLEIFRLTRRFVEDDFFVKSIRCDACSRSGSCRGLHANMARAQGLGILQPIA